MNTPSESTTDNDQRRFAHPKRRRRAKVILVPLVVLLAAIQFVPIEASNPPVESDISAPADVKAILKRSCYDCHSHETVWPWYSHVAPMSWLVANDVEEAREEMNFSTWGRYAEKKQRKKISECWEEVEDGEMPLWFYLPLHPKARLSEGDRQVLSRWAKAAGDGSSESHRGDDEDDPDEDDD